MNGLFIALKSCSEIHLARLAGLARVHCILVCCVCVCLCAYVMNVDFVCVFKIIRSLLSSCREIACTFTCYFFACFMLCIYACIHSVQFVFLMLFEAVGCTYCTVCFSQLHSLSSAV